MAADYETMFRGAYLQQDLIPVILREATGMHEADLTPEIKGRLELASAQLAVALNASVDGEKPDDLAVRVAANRSLDGDGHSDGSLMSVEGLLTVDECRYMPAARIVVGLAYQAARFPSQSRLYR